jgi:hypothetical protein
MDTAPPAATPPTRQSDLELALDPLLDGDAHRAPWLPSGWVFGSVVHTNKRHEPYFWFPWFFAPGTLPNLRRKLCLDAKTCARRGHLRPALRLAPGSPIGLARFCSLRTRFRVNQLDANVHAIAEP